jgi:GAF domain-containing protein
MWIAPKPVNEAERLEELRRLNLLDVAPDASFEALTRCAKIAMDAPAASISLIDEDRQWSMCKIGAAPRELPRAVTFCSHAIHTANPFIVTDATKDPRFADHPMVVGPPYVRSYLGIPLVTTGGGFALGTLCVVDTEPRDWSEAQVAHMSDLAKVTMTLIEVRDANRELLEARAQEKPRTAVSR